MVKIFGRAAAYGVASRVRQPDGRVVVETVHRGAFAPALKDPSHHLAVVRVDHDPRFIAAPAFFEDRGDGLWFQAWLSGPAGEAIAGWIARGELRGASLHIRGVGSAWDRTGPVPTRDIVHVDRILEVSLTDRPAWAATWVRLQGKTMYNPDARPVIRGGGTARLR
jgi:phage head maturation protease